MAKFRDWINDKTPGMNKALITVLNEIFANNPVAHGKYKDKMLDCDLEHFTLAEIRQVVRVIQQQTRKRGNEEVVNLRNNFHYRAIVKICAKKEKEELAGVESKDKKSAQKKQESGFVISELAIERLLKGNEYATKVKVLHIPFNGWLLHPDEPYQDKEVVLEEWFPSAVKSNDFQDSIEYRQNLLSNQVPGDEGFLVPLGKCTECETEGAAQVIYPGGTGSFTSLDAFFNNIKILKQWLSPYERVYIMRDIARAIACCYPSEEGAQQTDFNKRRMGYKKEIRMAIDMRTPSIVSCVDEIPTLKTKIERGEQSFQIYDTGYLNQIASKSIMTKEKGEQKIAALLEMGPEGLNEASPQKRDVWCFGGLCYSIWTCCPWESFTTDDLNRIIARRLGPKENNQRSIYKSEWIGNPKDGAAPANLYDLVQLSCWETNPVKRTVTFNGPSGIVATLTKVCEQLLLGEDFQAVLERATQNELWVAPWEPKGNDQKAQEQSPADIENRKKQNQLKIEKTFTLDIEALFKELDKFKDDIKALRSPLDSKEDFRGDDNFQSNRKLARRSDELMERLALAYRQASYVEKQQENAAGLPEPLVRRATQLKKELDPKIKAMESLYAGFRSLMNREGARRLAILESMIGKSDIDIVLKGNRKYNKDLCWENYQTVLKHCSESLNTLPISRKNKVILLGMLLEEDPQQAKTRAKDVFLESLQKFPQEASELLAEYVEAKLLSDDEAKKMISDVAVKKEIENKIKVSLQSGKFQEALEFSTQIGWPQDTAAIALKFFDEAKEDCAQPLKELCNVLKRASLMYGTFSREQLTQLLVIAIKFKNEPLRDFLQTNGSVPFTPQALLMAYSAQNLPLMQKILDSKEYQSEWSGAVFARLQEGESSEFNQQCFDLLWKKLLSDKRKEVLCEATIKQVVDDAVKKNTATWPLVYLIKNDAPLSAAQFSAIKSEALMKTVVQDAKQIPKIIEYFSSKEIVEQGPEFLGEVIQQRPALLQRAERIEEKGNPNGFFYLPISRTTSLLIEALQLKDQKQSDKMMDMLVRHGVTFAGMEALRTSDFDRLFSHPKARERMEEKNSAKNILKEGLVRNNNDLVSCFLSHGVTIPDPKVKEKNMDYSTKILKKYNASYEALKQGGMKKYQDKQSEVHKAFKEGKLGHFFPQENLPMAEASEILIALTKIPGVVKKAFHTRGKDTYAAKMIEAFRNKLARATTSQQWYLITANEIADYLKKTTQQYTDLKPEKFDESVLTRLLFIRDYIFLPAMKSDFQNVLSLGSDHRNSNKAP